MTLPKSKPHANPNRAPAALLTKDEVSDLLGVSTRTVENLMFSKSLSYIKLGRAVRFEPAAVERLLDSSRREAVA